MNLRILHFPIFLIPGAYAATEITGYVDVGIKIPYLFIFWVIMIWIVYHYIKGFKRGIKKPVRERIQEPIREEISRDQEDNGQDIVKEATEALVSLGYKPKYSRAIINEVLEKEEITKTEDLIKAALRKCAA